MFTKKILKLYGFLYLLIFKAFTFFQFYKLLNTKMEKHEIFEVISKIR